MSRHLFIVVLVLVRLSYADDMPKPTPIKHPELRHELIDRVKKDQDVRTAMVNWQKESSFHEVADLGAVNETRAAQYKELAESIKRIDRENTARLEKIVDQYGWPLRSQVGDDGANAAWLLVQHADLSPKFQRKCLDLMAHVPSDEISRMDVAYLTDRVLLAEGQKQIYGTQITFAEGKWLPRPLADAAKVDQRRAEVGLPPLADYIKEIEDYYGRTPKR